MTAPTIEVGLPPAFGEVDYTVRYRHDAPAHGLKAGDYLPVRVEQEEAPAGQLAVFEVDGEMTTREAPFPQGKLQGIVIGFYRRLEA